MSTRPRPKRTAKSQPASQRSAPNDAPPTQQSQPGAPWVLAAVGHNVPRAEGREKVTGHARYIDDVTMPGMLWGRTVRSTIPRGRILSVERDPSFDWTGFVVVDHRDVPAAGKNVVAMIVEDQPFLAVDHVTHREEPIMLLAHEDRARLEAALHHVKVTYEAEPAVLTLDEATVIQKQITIEKGDLARGFAEADFIVEGTYRTGHQEQLYIETNGVVAVPSLEGDVEGITVFGSMQCPFYVSRALETLLGLPREKVRVVQTTTGGGFGGKEEYPSVIAGHAALLARKAGRAVKVIYDRLEDLTATTKRHPSLTRHRTGVTKEGVLTAVEVDFRLDGGAYVTLSPVVLSRGAIHAAGPYRVPNVSIRARSLQTNTPPNGAFRGFGAPQSLFAIECHMDRIAQELGIDPIVLRRKNLLHTGDTTATGQLLDGPVGAEEVLDRAIALHNAGDTDVVQRSKANDMGEPQQPGVMRGTGVSLYLHGSGFTGGGELKLQSKAAVEVTRKGVRLLVSSTEIGQGTRTMHAQIVADTLGIPFEWVETSDPDTREVPDSGPTVASRTCMVVGRILQRAADQLSAAIGHQRGDKPKSFRKKARAYLDSLGGGGRGVFEASYERPGEMIWSDETYKGDAYGAYAWGCNIADVEVDPLTWQARCTRITSALDVGKAIHPLLVEGQIEGGTLQGVGFALLEEVVMKNGSMANGQLTNYIIPTTLDTPEMRVAIVENAYAHGPFGAKGVGEAPIDGPAPAIINAIRAATGVRIDEVPATPERIMAKLLAHARPGRDDAPIVAAAAGGSSGRKSRKAVVRSSGAGGAK